MAALRASWRVRTLFSPTRLHSTRTRPSVRSVAYSEQWLAKRVAAKQKEKASRMANIHRFGKSHVCRPCDPIVSAALLDRSTTPMDAFDESVRRGTATAATADACLRAFDAQISSKSWPEAVQATKSVAPAKRVLLWLWSSTLTREDVDDFFSSPAAMWLLVCNAQLEGNTELLWQWLTIDAGVFDGGEEASHYTWRGTLHRFMIVTKLFLLGMEKSTQADEAIDLVLALSALKRRHPSHVLLRNTSLHPGLIVLVPHICTPYWPDTSPEAYKRLTDLVTGYVKSGTSRIPGVSRRDLYLARLELWRPRTPNPDQAVELLRNFAESRKHGIAHLPTEEQKLIYNLAKASVACLRKLGRNSECEEIAKIGTLCGAGRVISP